MSEKLICPYCESEKTKKSGFNSKKEQRYKCSSCGKSFYNTSSNVVSKTKEVKEVKKKQNINSSSKLKKKTIIKVNNNIIKEIDKDIDIDDAFNLISSYFREITKTDATITELEGEKTILFTVKTGTKG